MTDWDNWECPCAMCNGGAEPEYEEPEFHFAEAEEPKCICYPGYHDMPGGREPACPAP